MVAPRCYNRTCDVLYVVPEVREGILWTYRVILALHLNWIGGAVGKDIQYQYAAASP